MRLQQAPMSETQSAMKPLPVLVMLDPAKRIQSLLLSILSVSSFQRNCNSTSKFRNSPVHVAGIATLRFLLPVLHLSIESLLQMPLLLSPAVSQMLLAHQWVQRL